MAQKNIRTDRFGNPYQVVGCRDKKGNGFAFGYVELGGKLYKLEPSPANKEGVEMWIKVTAVKKQSRSTSM
ncbi:MULTISPECIES: hypothetical protein [Flavobacterium]|uniref:hypothetical protein n=1 Tax=Flavobacterium TaxID=237 RepID=UPI002113A3DB|nr:MULTISPECIES: hypothetical protein [Flavobacterium]UUF13244.1 hypothetical protein NLJ00_18450 [Flavobacterium panici]